MTSRWFKLLTVVAALAAAAFLSAAAVFAQAGDLGVTVNGGLETGRTVVGFGAEPLQVIIMRIVQIALGFLGILAIVLILYGGVVWMTAGGDEGKIETAKAILRNATIGLLIILAAFAIASFVLRALVGAFGPGDGTGGPCPVVGEVDTTCDTGVAACSGSRTCNTNFRWDRCVPNPLDTDCPVPPPPRQCLVNSIKPVDGSTLKIKNVVVRATLNLRVTNAADVVAHPEWFGIVRQGAAVADGQPCTGNDQCLSDRCDQVIPGPAPKTCVGNTVAGTVKVSGYVASFTPARICEPPFDAGAKLRHCFSENTAYEVHLQPTDIQCGNKPLVCAGGCASTFTTGTLVDIAAPTVDLWPSQICQAPANQLSARYTDDVGVSVVSFTDLTHGDPIGVDDLTAFDPGEFKLDGTTPEDDTDGIAHNLAPPQPAWDTSDATKFAVSSKVEVEAVAEDQDENAARDTRTFTIRAGHCCNATQDADEESIDCGGADCNRCGDGIPVIDYISPADPGATANNPAIPSTYDDDTPHGATDNFITLTGRNFGDDPGRVIFLGAPAAGDEVDAALPTAVNAACPADTWSDDEIIVAVPAGAVDGPMMVLTKATASRPAMSDATNDGDGTRERKINDFDVDPALVFPGLCGVDPVSGKYRDPGVTLEGVRLGDAAGSDVFFGAVAASEPPATWRADEKGVDTIEVPNARPGKVGVTVKAGPNASNSVRFTVTAGDATDPVIYRFTPTSGGEGTYVTINGANFGDVPGKVFFLSGAGPDIEANDPFPLECRDDLWRSDRIIVKVPNNATNGLIQVRRADGRTADSSSVIEAAGQPERKEFDVNNVVTPGLCKIQPRLGPAGVPVTLSGERLENYDEITFFNAKTAVETARAFSPALDTVSTAVPVGAQTGDVTVADTGPNPDAVSNGLRFTVGTCTGNSQCGGTEECCSVGPLTGACMPKGECGGAATAGAYRYYFTTGQPGAGVVTACTRSVNDCSARGIASPTPYTVSAAGTGAVVLAGRRDDGAVPVNAVVSVHFTEEINAATLGGNVSVLKCNIGADFSDAACTGAVPFALESSGGVAPAAKFIVLTPTVALDADTWYRPVLTDGIKKPDGTAGIQGNNADGKQFRWQFKTNADLGTVGCIDCMPAKSELTRQYTATEVEGVNARKLKGVAFAGGQACVMLRTTAPWTWTVDPADTAQLSVPPSATAAATARAIGETPGDNPATPIFDPDLAKVVAHLTAPPRDTSCLIGVTFNPPVVVDQWPNCGSACVNAEIGAAFNRPLNAEAVVAAAAYASSIVNPGNIRLYSCGADYACAFASQADVKITPPVYLEGSVGATCGDGTRDNDDDGNFDPFEEECDDDNSVSGDGCSSACLFEGSNALYGSTCGNSRKETGEQCDDGNTVDSDGCSRVCLPTGGRPSGTRGVGEKVPEVRFYPAPSHYYGSLVPGTYYRVVLNGAIASAEGKRLGNLNYAASGVATDPPDAYSWVFKTSDDPRLCAISSVAVAPASITLRPDALQRYAAGPSSRPDACSSRGQRLNPYGYQWAWDSSSRPTADFPNRAAGFADACGNGVLELGEDCDVGVVGGTAACSQAADTNACLTIGGSPTCGDRRLDRPLEECDDGNVTNGDGCSSTCLNEGNSNWGVRVCGNGVVENDPDAGVSLDAASRLDADEEECDDGNLRNGDGCSSRCLWEGAIAGVSVCGDGILGRGESCETCGSSSERTSNNERTIYAGSCGGSDFANNVTPNKSDDDCDSRCVIDPAVNSRGVDRRAPYPVCGNGVVEAGEECDTGTETGPGPGDLTDGCTERCTHAGSVYDTAAFDPPRVGPYQLAKVAPAASFPGVPVQTNITAGTLGTTGTGVLKVAFGLGAFRITAFQPTDVTPACLTQYAVVTFSQAPEAMAALGPKVTIKATNPIDGTVVATPALTFEYDAVSDPLRVRIKPTTGAWPAKTKLEFTFADTIANADASSTLDCTGAACTFAFTTGTSACSISRLDVQPTRAFVEFAATQQYKVTAYGATHGPVVRATTLPPANRQPRIANFYSCPGNPATARIFTVKLGAAGFNVTVTEGGADVTASLKDEGVPQAAVPFDADDRVVPLGCFLALDYRQTRDDPQTDDQVVFTATLGYTEAPFLPGGEKYAWSTRESEDDTAGSDAVQSLAPLDCPAANTENRCADVKAVSRWPAAPPPADPSYGTGEGYRTARVIAKDPLSPVTGSAWFGVGNLCTKPFGSGTLADIYPLRPPATASSTAVAHFDGGGDLVTGDGRVIRPSVSSGVDYTKAGLTDGGAAVLGNSATFSAAATSALDLPNTGGLFSPEEGTISLWFKLDPAQSSPLFAIRPSGALWAKYDASDGKVHLVYTEGSRFHRQSRALPAPLDVVNPWHYLVARWREREVAGEQRVEVALTLDGDLAAVTETAGSAENPRIGNPTAVHVGHDPLASEWMTGTIDEFEIRRDYQGDAEITARWEAYVGQCLGATPGVAGPKVIGSPEGTIACVNPLVMATFDVPMDEASILHTNAGAYDRFLVCPAASACDSPDDSLVGRLTYDSTSRTVQVAELANARLEDPSLILKLDFDNSSLRDSSGNGNDGGCTGDACPQWVSAGLRGGAYRFDGINDFVNAGTVLDADKTKPFTLAAWVNPAPKVPQGGDNTWRTIIGTESSWAEITLDTQGNQSWPNMMQNGGGPGWALPSPDPILDGEWHHVVGVYDGANATLYVDGILRNGPVAKGFTRDHGATLIGRFTLAGGEPREMFSGAMDEVRIWNRALSPAEVSFLHSGSVFSAGQSFKVRIVGGLDGVQSEAGINMPADFSWTFQIEAAAKVCNCTSVVVRVAPPTPAAVRRTDAFTCAGGAVGTKACPDDQDAAAGGNQHAYTAQCVDATVSPPQAVNATYAWTVTNSKIVSAAPPDQQSTFVTNTVVNGDAQVRVRASGVAPATGEQTGAVQVVNFVCANPWPPLYSFPFNDLEMHFDLSYCRDPAHTPSTADDLPALQSPPAVIEADRGNVLKEFFFANTFGTPQTLLQSKLGSEVKGVKVNTETVVTPPESAGCERSTGGAAFNYAFDFPDVGHYQLQAEVVNIDRRFSDPNTIKVQLNTVDVGSPQRLSSLDERQTAIFDLGQVAKGTRDISLLFTDDDGVGVNQSLTVCKVGIAKAAISHDVIGLKVLTNPLRLSPATWYASGICAGRPVTVANLCTRDADCGGGVACTFNVPNRGNPSELAVDGYAAVRDGRSVYVAGTNLSGANLYTNIYLLSYNEGAADPTTEIFGQLVQRLTLNTNLANNRFCSATTNNVCTSDLDCPRDASGFPVETCDAPKDKVRRDSRRIGELRDLELATNAVNRANGVFPLWDAVRRQFSGGTYLPGITFSPWPSWVQGLGASLRGQRLPKDPLNTFLGCQKPYDAVTCWDERALAFKCTAPAYVYGYKVEPQGASRQLATTFEYTGAAQWYDGTTIAPFACANFGVAANGDRDGDGVLDTVDNCPDTANAGQDDGDIDKIGDVCDPCRTSAENDADHDGFCLNGADNPGGNGDNCATVFNPDQRDSDANGQGDACDNTCSRDADRDGVCDEQDNCPTVANSTQTNSDPAQDTAKGQVWPNGLTWGDTCDLCTDVDGDGYGAGLPAETCKKDNCSAEANPSQDDYDNDGVGYACDSCIDTDNDRLTDQLIANSGFEEGTKGFRLFVSPGADAALTAAASYRRLETLNDGDLGNDNDHGDVWRGIRSARLDLTTLIPGSYVGLRTDANPARLAASRDFGVRYFAQAQVKPSDPALVSRLRLHAIRTCTKYPAKAGPHGLAFRGTCGDPNDDPGYDDDTTATDPDVPGEPGLGFRVPLTLPNAVQDLKNGWYTIRTEFAAPTNLAADEIAFELIVEGGGPVGSLWVDDFTAGLVCAHCAESCPRPASELPPIGWDANSQLYRPMDNCNTFNNFNDAVRNCSGTGGDANGYSVCTAADLDEDNVGDACDLCTDRDGDGFGDGPAEQRRACPGSFSRVDNCPVTVNADQRDYDNDAATCNFATPLPYRQSGAAGNCSDPRSFDLSCRFCGGNACDLDADGDRCFNWSQLQPIPGNGNFPSERDVAPKLVARRERPAGNWLQFSGDQDVDGLPTDCDAQTCGNGVLENVWPAPLRTLPGLEKIVVYEVSDCAAGPRAFEFAVDSDKLLVDMDQAAALLGDPPNDCDIWISGLSKCYDVFFSHRDGQANIDGGYLTVQSVRPPIKACLMIGDPAYPGRKAVNLNIDAVKLDFGGTRPPLYVTEAPLVIPGMAYAGPPVSVGSSQCTGNAYQMTVAQTDWQNALGPEKSAACTDLAMQYTAGGEGPNTGLTFGFDTATVVNQCFNPVSGVQQCEECDLKDFTLGDLPPQQQQFMVDNFCAICANLQCSVDTLRSCLQLTGKEGVLGRDVTFTRNPDILRRVENRTEFLWVGAPGVMKVRKMVALDYLDGLPLGDTFGNGTLEAGFNQQMYNFSVFLGTALDKLGQCPNRVWIPNRDQNSGGGDQGIAYEFSACPNDNPLVSNAHLMRGCKAGYDDHGILVNTVDTRGNSWSTVESGNGMIVMTLASTNDSGFPASGSKKGELYDDGGCRNNSSEMYIIDRLDDFSGAYAYAMEVDSQNNLWVVNPNGTTLKIDLDWIYTKFPSPFSGGKHPRVIQLRVNSASKVCALIDKETGESSPNHCQAFSTPYGHEIVIDANDNAWVAAYREGASIAQLRREIYGIDATATKWGDAKIYTPGVTQPRYLAVDINNYLWVASGVDVKDVTGVPTIVETNGIFQVYTTGANIGKRTDVDVFFNGPGDATGKNRNYGIAADSEGFLWMMYQGDGQPGKVLRIDTTKPDPGDGGLGGMRDGSRGRLITDVFDIPGGFRDNNSPWTRSSIQTGLNPRILKSALGGEVIVDGGNISFESVDTPVSGWQKRWGKVLYDVTLNGGEITRADVYLTDNEADFASLASTAWIPVDEFNRLIGKTPVQSAADYNTGGRKELEIAGRYLRLRFQAKPDPLDPTKFPVVRNLRITCKDPAGNDICP